MKNLRMMIHSNAPFCATGYGISTNGMMRLFAERLGPENVSVLCNFGLQRGTMKFDGIEVFPVSSYGDILETLLYFPQLWRASHVICHSDLWVWTKSGNFAALKQHLREEASWKMIAYPPIDSYPMAIGYSDVFNICEHIIAMSVFGKGVLEKQGYHPKAVIGFGADTESFYHVPEDVQSDRKAFGIPSDAFVFLVNAFNRGPRKGIYETLYAFKEFLVANPNATDAFLYLNCDPLSPDGYNLAYLLKMMNDVPGLDLSKRVTWTTSEIWRNSMSVLDMVRLYNAADVVINASHGEGFGRVYVEAGSMSLPVIASDNTNTRELIHDGETGIVVPVSQGWMADLSYTIMHPPQISEITKAMARYYYDRSLVVKHGEAGRKFMVENFDWKPIGEKWFKFFETL